MKVTATAPVLLVVPPFQSVNRPSYAAHLLQACAQQAGARVDVLYTNVWFAAEFGDDIHQRICYTSASSLIGERLFAAAAFGVPMLGRGFTPQSAKCAGYEYAQLLKIAKLLPGWIERVSFAISAGQYGIVGCTTMFEQTSAAFAILAKLSAFPSPPLRILGGANCEGDMAAGIWRLGQGMLDYVFSGESEKTFVEFLELVRGGALPKKGVIRGTPCRDLDSLPTPDFDEYFDQVREHLPESEHTARERTWIPYESSRGCWWGEKHHCTFCGVNGEGMIFRERSPAVVKEALKKLRAKHDIRNICMLDNIMPHRYFSSLLPEMKGWRDEFHIFYEQKSNLTLRRVEGLRAAGIGLIQPGIEALSTPLLRLMKKGVTAHQNLNLLRFARVTGTSVNWNLIWGFPNDKKEWYETTLDLIPLIRHLHPPTGLCRLSIERFSPYFDNPAHYGISEIRPVDSYGQALPKSADSASIAYHFEATYSSGSRDNPDVIERLNGEILHWRRMWGTGGRTTSPESSAKKARDREFT